MVGDTPFSKKNDWSFFVDDPAATGSALRGLCGH